MNILKRIIVATAAIATMPVGLMIASDLGAIRVWRLVFALMVIMAISFPVHAAVISYTDDGSFTASSFSDGGVTVSGSNTINVNIPANSGLGVVGGDLNQGIGSNELTTGISEWIEFVADGNGEFSSFILRGGGWSAPPSGSILIELFSTTSVNLGSISGNPNDINWFGYNLLELAALSGPADRIRITAVEDVNFGIAEIGVMITPIPAALPLFLSGLGLLGFFGWRRKQAAV